MAANWELGELLDIAAECEGAVRAQVEKLAGLEKELAGLEGRTCTGREWWRDRDKEGKSPKLYILHSISQDCPIHGKPKPTRRLRIYVGSDVTRIRVAREAIELEKKRQQLYNQAERIRRGLAQCGLSLRSFYRVLGCGGQL